MKYFRWWVIFIAMAAIVGMLAAPPARAQSLPAGYIGIVNQTSTYIYQQFSYSWTAPTTGVDYVGLAFRQDPGYWSVGSLKLTAAGSSTNLLNNGNLQYGGYTSTGLAAPADWGVWYQNGTYPAAAGTWYAPGTGWMGSTTSGLGVNTGTSGSWIDGAVGSFDGIYQGFSATAGTTYNFSFYSAGSNPYSNPSIMIGVYAGSCASGSTVFSCSPVTSSGFTALATPQQTQGTGGAPPPTDPAATSPTVVSTSTTNRVTTSVSYGTATTTTSYVQRQVNGYDAQGFQVTRTYVDTVTTTTTPRYTTTTTTPVTTTTWSDGTTTTADGTTTTSTTTDYVVSTTTTQATTPSSTTPWLTGGASSAPFNASTANTTKVQAFVTRTTADSRVNIEQIGNFNTTTIDQSGSKNNYVNYKVNGSNNTATIKQSSTPNTQANYVDASVTGNNNNLNITQTSTSGAKGAFVTVNNSNNTVKLQQTDSGNHYAEVNISGGNKNVDILQQGSASHMASVTITGYAQNLTLQQTGSTQQFYSINANCATAGGCGAIAVRQGN